MTLRVMITLMTDQNHPEKMAAFFDQRVDGYDNHMFQSLNNADTYDRILTQPIGQTQKQLTTLDIGC